MKKILNQGDAYGADWKVLDNYGVKKHLVEISDWGQFSPFMLSRFETGQSELSVEKFLFALGDSQCRGNPLARGFQ